MPATRAAARSTLLLLAACAACAACAGAPPRTDPPRTQPPAPPPRTQLPARPPRTQPPAPPRRTQPPAPPPRTQLPARPPRGAQVTPPRRSERARPEHPRFWAWLTDANGLSVGSPVTIAGLPSGRIAAIQRGPHGTRIDITVPEVHRVWTNARLWKRPTGRKGVFRLTLDPGEGPPTTSQAERFAPRQLADGDEIANVIDEVTAQDLLDDIDRALPGR